MTRVVMACGQADVELDCFAGARNDEAWQADVLGCFVGNGDDIRTLDWIASRFRASTLAMTDVANGCAQVALAMTGGVYLGFNGLSVIFINKCVLMCGMSLRTRQDDE